MSDPDWRFGGALIMYGGPKESTMSKSLDDLVRDWQVAYKKYHEVCLENLQRKVGPHTVAEKLLWMQEEGQAMAALAAIELLLINYVCVGTEPGR